MGSGGSKEAAFAAADGGGGRSRGRRRSLGARVLGAACLGSPSVLSCDQESGRSKTNTCTDDALSKSNLGSHEGCRKFRFPRAGRLTSSNSSRVVIDVEGQENTYHADSSASNNATTQIASYSQSLNSSSNSASHSCSRFGFIADGIGFRLRRAASLGSSRGHSLLSAGFSAPQANRGDHVQNVSNGSSNDRNEIHQDGIVRNVASQDVVRSITNIETSGSGHSQRIPLGTENFETRRPNRRLGLREPVEGSIRFSRTLSVGRLRDRVLRRTSFSDGLFGPMLLEDRSVGYTAQGNGRRVLSSAARADSSLERNVDVLPSSSSNNHSSISSSTDGNHDHEPATPQLRETSNREILEHRSAFLERRRRIRSQVRALQRLGSRFENLPGHDRSCILSGQHRTGRCTCRMNSRPANPDDETSTRSSISRIVMLAEALFEVLDEIHQQAVVLASRPSVSSIGSVPAPKEVVECMPVKIFGKPQKHLNDEAAQCYICLVEYEEGDSVRILPCHHEFHRTCVDKWLKEVHRVCPLCRGDVCRSDVPPMEKLS